MFPTSSIGNIRLAANGRPSDKSAMAGLLKTRVAARLDELKLNPFEAARAGELERNFVNDILDERKLSVRGPNLLKLARALQCSADYLINVDAPAPKGKPPSGADHRLVPAFLPVRYKVAAGVWYEMDGDAQTFLGPARPVAPDPRYIEWPQWLEEVVGDSVNLKIPEGGFAHVVDAIDMGYAPRDGDYVVVERRRAGGHIRERTIKQVVMKGDAVELWPRSTNPKWSEPVRAGDADGEIEVEVVGLVIGAYLGF